MSSLWFAAGILFFLNIYNVQSLSKNNSDGVLTVAHKWVKIDLEYPNTKSKNEALKKGEYIQKNLMPLDSDYHPGTDRYFVAMPPFRNGTPASLGQISRGQSQVKPFPKWPNFNDKNNCKTGPPFSVYRIFIDKCGLLWVPDTGINESLTSSKMNCPPKLLVYDLNSNKDKEVLRYEFPQSVITDRSLVVNIFTESYKSDCSDSIAYIADIMDYAMIVFDYAKKTSWRISHKYFRMFPSAPTMSTNGVSLDLNDGLCGMALSPVADQERKLYFHSFSSLHESWAPVSVLKNSTAVQDALVLRNNFHLSPGIREGQSTVQVMTDDGILIYPVIPNNTLTCWNYRTPFTKENQHVMIRDDEKFQFISGLKLIGNKLLATSSRFHNYFLSNTSDTNFNFYLTMVDDVRKVLQNTPCVNVPHTSGLDTREPSNSSHNTHNGGSSCQESGCERPHSQSHSSSHSSTHHPHSHHHSHGHRVFKRQSNNTTTRPRNRVTDDTNIGYSRYDLKSTTIPNIINGTTEPDETSTYVE